MLGLVLGVGHGALSQAWAQASNAGLPPDLKTLIAESLKANPEIKQKSQLKAAAKETIRPAGALDNPQAAFAMPEYAHRHLELHPGAHDPEGLRACPKRFPFPGKRRLRSEVAEEQAQSDDLAYQDKANEVRAKW